MDNYKTNEKAFTLIELIVVMAIIAILVLLAAPRFLGYTKDASVTAMQQDTKVLTDASELYHLHEGEWPLIEGGTPVSINIGGGAIDEVFPIDETKLESSIKNIKGNYDEYGIAVAGKYKGQVFHINGVKDKDEELHYSHGVSGRGLYTKFEIDSFLSQGYIPIANVEDLDNVRNNLDGNYIQIAHIDLSDIENFGPIGNSENHFTGTYDGAGFTLSNMKINRNLESNVGLFGSVKNGVVKNVGIENANVNGNENVGGLAGYIESSKIMNSYTTGDVLGNNGVGGLVGLSTKESEIESSHSTSEIKNNGKWKVGGLVGQIHNGSSVINSYATGNIDGKGTRIGGLVGESYLNSVVKDSYATGDVSGTEEFVGGLMGYNNLDCTITESYATGTVRGLADRTGGLVGMNRANGIIDKSYSTGDVTGEGNHTGGLVGFNNHDSTISKSYSTSNVKGTSYVGGLVGQNYNNGHVNNSYSTGEVVGENYVGGLVGMHNTSSLSDSYSVSMVKGTGNRQGGLVGRMFNQYGNESTVENSYSLSSNGEVIGTMGYGVETGNPKNNIVTNSKSVSNEMLKLIDLYSSWDKSIWDIQDGKYPTLK